MNDVHPVRGIGSARPYVELAAELSSLGQRLDDIGDELLRLQGLPRPGGARADGTHRYAAGRAAERSSAAHPDGPQPYSEQSNAGWAYSTQAFVPRVYAEQQCRTGPYGRQPRPQPAGAHLHPAPSDTGQPRVGQSNPGQFYPGGSGAGVPGRTSGAAPAAGRSMLRPVFRSVSALSGARLLAWTGGAVTLLGVVLLLVLAASRGWFAPPVRISAGAALGVALVGLGWRLHRRTTARTGAIALAATGLVTLNLVLAAATATYGYLDPVPALLLALLLAGGGLGLADRWRSQLLGGGVVLAAALHAPVLAGGWLLVALLLALQVAALPVLLHRRWPRLMLAAAAGPVLSGVVEASARPAGLGVAVAVLVTGLGTAALAARTLPAAPVATLIAATPLPVIVAAAELDGWPGAALCAAAGVGVALLAASVRTDRRLRLVAATAAAVVLFEATGLAVDGATATAVVLGQAVLAAVLAALLRNRFALGVAGAYGAVGVARAAVLDAPLAALVEFPRHPFVEPEPVRALLAAASVSLLVVALAVALLFACGRVSLVRQDARSAPLWVPIGVVGLYGTTSLVVALALLVAPDRTGFTAGHALVTVSWTVLALFMLAGGLSKPALRVTGLVLVAAAVAKLLLFDLVALDGVARVAAFLGAGLVLLAAGTRYARLVAEAIAADAAPANRPPHR